MRRWWRDDRGNAVVELAPVALALIMFLVLLITAGRITAANLAVQDAAQSAARQASLARDPAGAETAALPSARAALAGDGLDCQPTVTLTTTGFAVPVGEPASVAATVTCHVNLTGLNIIPGVPGQVAVSASASSPLDTFRGRTEGQP
jgi:Flp pilus assembly protein TadG